MQMKKGQRDRLEKYIDDTREFAVILYISGSAEYDYTCFGLDARDKLSDDRYMIFYNQVSSPKNEISYSKINDGSMFKINLKSLPSFIKKLVFAVSIDGEGTMGDITTHKMVILQDKQPKVNFQFDGKDFRSEKAIISFELYQKNEWRINVVGSGYNGGLADLLKEYGGEQVDEEQQRAQVKQVSASSFSPQKDTSGKQNQDETKKPDLEEEFRLGLKYSKYRLDKRGTTDDGKAIEHFKNASDQGHAAAQYFLGRYYYDNDQESEEDYRTARELFLKSANQNNVYGQLYLGLCYWKGRGGDVDAEASAKWFKKAADKECPEGMYFLFEANARYDIEVTQNPLELLIMAANLGSL